MKKLSRRRALEVLGAAGVALAAGCSSSPTSPTTATADASAGSGTGTTAASGCVVTPEETAGPYPDRTGMFGNPSFYRRDVTEGRPGVPLALTMTVVNVKNSCASIANAVVEIWHCDTSGNYSEYGSTGTQTFLRGLQTTDASGAVSFLTIYPGWYAGRATHIHVEVFINGSAVKTTQIAFPESVTATVYGSSIYASRGQNPTTNSRDNVFSDGVNDELATVTGSVNAGYTATLTIGVSV
jgi:protocatechuate 3,4-dioxygenase beta subunit